MNQEALAVKLLASGTTIHGTLVLEERAAAGAEEPCSLRLSCQAGKFEATAPDYFEALVRLRRDLEHRGLQILVNGASRDVWPSAMARSMSLGLQAYRMHLGRQALKSDLVPVFELAPESQPCSVAEQELFREQWFASLGSAA